MSYFVVNYLLFKAEKDILISKIREQSTSVASLIVYFRVYYLIDYNRRRSWIYLPKGYCGKYMCRTSKNGSLQLLGSRLAGSFHGDEPTFQLALIQFLLI